MFDHLLELLEDIPERDLEEYANNTYSLRLSMEEWDALRAVILSLKLADMLKQQRLIRAYPKLVAACHAALSVEGLPTPIRKQLEKAVVIADE